MAKRQTVSISIDAVENFIEKKGWSNSHFCKDIMGKGRGWISEWKRRANFPSPEEAAKMCVKFDCVPEDIIVDIEDQSIVSKILEKEKAPTPIKSVEAMYIAELANSLPEQKRKDAVAFLLALQKEADSEKQ